MKTKLVVLSAFCVILMAVDFQSSFGRANGPQVQYQFTPVSYLGRDTAAYGINQRGDIVGRFRESSKSLYSLINEDHGFVQRGDSLPSIDFPKAISTIAYGINRQGQIVGAYSMSAAEPFHGFLFENWA